MPERPAYLRELAAFVAGASFSSLPAEVVERARWLFADTVAVIGAGAQEAETRRLTDRMVPGNHGPAPVIGAPHRAAPATAAFLNGTAGTFLELDEGNQFCRGHPGIHVLPAVLAEAQALGASGERAVLAAVLGYEVGARIGIASKLRMTMHPHGTWGTVGAAVAIASLHSYDREQVAEIINVASCLGLATSRRTMLEGGTVRNAYAGFSNQLGMTAHHLVQAGFEGERDGLATVYGTVIADDFRPDLMVAELGTRWELARNYFKRHACCRYNHATLDALRQVLDRHGGGLDPACIARVEVQTYSLAAQLSDPRPRNMLAAKFSVPFAVATFLVHRAASVEAFRDAARADAAVLDLAARVQVTEDPILTAMVPAYRPARVRVHLDDGTVEEAEARVNRGDTEDPYTADDRREKFFELATPVWGVGAAPLFQACMRFERLPSLAAFADLLPLTPAEAAAAE